MPRIQSLETRMKISKALKGVPKSPEHVLHMKQATNPGKFKDGDNAGHQKYGGVTKGYTYPPDFEVWNKGKRGVYAQETLLLMSETQASLWRDDKYAKRQFKSISRPLNRQERIVATLLDTFLPGHFRYVGDGSLVIGGKCPDFASTRGNLLIEYNGFLWHGNDLTIGHTKAKDHLKSEHYRILGWETLNLYPQDIKEDYIASTLVRIYEFVMTKGETSDA